RGPGGHAAAWQAQADVRPAHGHRRLRCDRQRREDCGHGQQAHRQVHLPPLRLPGWAAPALGRRDDREAPGPAAREGDQGHAAEEPPRAGDGQEAQGLRGPGAPPRRSEAHPVRDPPGRAVTAPEEDQPVSTPEPETPALEDEVVEIEPVIDTDADSDADTDADSDTDADTAAESD